MTITWFQMSTFASSLPLLPWPCGQPGQHHLPVEQQAHGLSDLVQAGKQRSAAVAQLGPNRSCSYLETSSDLSRFPLWFD